MISTNEMIWMCKVWICCLLIIYVTTLTLQMLFFFWYGAHILIELLWLELLSQKFASCYQSTILHITKVDYKYFPFWVWSSLLPITLWFKGLWSQGLLSEVIDIGVCSIKAKLMTYIGAIVLILQHPEERLFKTEIAMALVSPWAVIRCITNQKAPSNYMPIVAIGRLLGKSD